MTFTTRIRFVKDTRDGKKNFLFATACTQRSVLQKERYYLVKSEWLFTKIVQLSKHQEVIVECDAPPSDSRYEGIIRDVRPVGMPKEAA